MFVTHLSTDLHLDIASFLDDDDKVVFGSCCVRFYKDLLLDHLRRLKRSTSNFLNEFESNEETRERFTKDIHFPERQVHIHVPMSHTNPSFPFPRVYYLCIEMDQLQQHYLQQIEKIHTLDLKIDSTQEYAELLFLPERLGIKHLYISFYGSKVRPSLPVVPSPSLERLVLSAPCFVPNNLTDIFPHLHELFLRHVDCVSDVSMFVNIKRISFFCCHNITDITPLQTTSYIAIESCRGIVDYRNALTYSYRIAIKSPNPDAIIDVSCFKAVKTLELSPSYNSSILSSLTGTNLINLKRLTIEGDLYSLFKDNVNQLQELTVSTSTLRIKVDIFGCIPVLRLLYLNEVESLDGLGYDEDISKSLRNRSVTISQLGKVKDFTPLNTVPFVNISSCDGFRDLSQVKDVKRLIVRYCYGIAEPSVPLNNESLTLAGEMPDNLLMHLANVKELDLRVEREENLCGLDTLKNLERIVVPSYWNEQETAGWEILREDYLKFEYNLDATIYVKKIVH